MEGRSLSLQKGREGAFSGSAVPFPGGRLSGLVPELIPDRWQRTRRGEKGGDKRTCKGLKKRARMRIDREGGLC